MKAKNTDAMISIIVPVLREGDKINHFLEQVPETAGDDLIEIVVVDGDEKRSTIKHIKMKNVVLISSQRGRGVQMNRGAANARGEILLFLHADTILPENAFALVRNALADSKYIGGAFDLGIDSDRFLLRLAARCASLKHRITRVPYGDQAIFVRADFFHDIGGFCEIPLFEDVELMRRIKKSGKKIIILSQRTKTSPRKWEREGTIRTILKNWGLQAAYVFGASSEFLARRYYGNDTPFNIPGGRI